MLDAIHSLIAWTPMGLPAFLFVITLVPGMLSVLKDLQLLGGRAAGLRFGLRKRCIDRAER